MSKIFFNTRNKFRKEISGSSSVTIHFVNSTIRAIKPNIGEAFSMEGGDETHVFGFGTSVLGKTRLRSSMSRCVCVTLQ